MRNENAPALAPGRLCFLLELAFAPRLEAGGGPEDRLAAADRAVLLVRRVTGVATDISADCAAADAGRCWLRHRLRCRLVEAAWATAAAFGRNQVLLNHLEQLRDAQLVHAGPEVVSLGPQVFVHALGQPDRDNTGRLAFGVGRVLLLAELDQPFLDLVELLAFFEGRQVFEAGELTANYAVDTQDFAKERDPIRL